jgi:hypothetical protein
MNTATILQSCIVKIIEGVLASGVVLQLPAVPAQAGGAVGVRGTNVAVGMLMAVGVLVGFGVGEGFGVDVAVIGTAVGMTVGGVGVDVLQALKNDAASANPTISLSGLHWFIIIFPSWIGHRAR